MYVFGIDMPIMELLFILAVMMVAALIFVVWEIRKLRKLILREQSDINRFEENIGKISNKTSSGNNRLSSYVKKAINNGLKKKDIEKSLIKSGWSKDDINKAFEKV